MKVMGDIVNLVGPLSISIILSYMTMVKRHELPHGTVEKVYVFAYRLTDIVLYHINIFSEI